MTRTIAVFLILAATASAQTVTYDSRFDARPDWRGAIDTSDRSVDNPDLQTWMLQYKTPAMLDALTKVGVSITGTLAQAQADLQRAISNAVPAIVRERGKDIRQEVRNVRANAASANSVPALRDQVARLAELVEQQQERIERLENK